jgi:flagellar biosynthesis chaperone FliJ
MSSTSRHPVADLRSFRWALLPLETRRNATLETARLALGLLRVRERALQQAVQARLEERAVQQRLARSCVQQDPARSACLLAYLAQLEQGIVDERASASALAVRLDAARLDCVRRQRELASIHALRESAEHLHAREQLRRMHKEADAAWLARHASPSPMARAEREG